MSPEQLSRIVEAALLAAGRPLKLEDLQALFAANDPPPDKGTLRELLEALREQWDERGVELVEVASGFRFQIRAELGEWMARLWTERPPRYSRALLETLALVAYRQPITRGEIEDVRGVTVSTSIIRTLLEREWIRVLGHRDVPGRPALYGTTREFLDAFGLKSLEEMPPLSEIADLDRVHDDLFASTARSPDEPEPESAPAAVPVPALVATNPDPGADAEPAGVDPDDDPGVADARDVRASTTASEAGSHDAPPKGPEAGWEEEPEATPDEKRKAQPAATRPPSVPGLDPEPEDAAPTDRDGRDPVA